MRHWKIPLALAFGLLLAQGTLAAPDPATVKKAEALIKAGKAAEAFDLLEPLEISEAGDIDFDYLLATAALESGKPSKATFIYERILAIDPNFIGVRADMGRAYFTMGDYARAKIEFENVLSSQSAPPDLKIQVEQYVRAVEARAQAKKTVTTSYVEVGFGSDNNIGSAPSASSLTLPASGAYTPTPPTGRKTADNYATLGAGGEVNHQLSEQWGVYAGGDFRGRDYRAHNDPNNWTLDGRLGTSYSSGTWLLRTGLTAGTYYYYGAHLRDSVGLNADWRMALSTSSQITASGSVVRAVYLPSASASQSSVTYTGSLGWLTASEDGATIYSLTGSGGYEDDIKSRDDGNRSFFGPRVLVQTSFSDSLGGYVTGGATRSDYSRNNSYYLKKRSETLYDLTLALSWTVSKGFTLRPQFSYLRNHSNAELYSYDKADTSLNLRMDY